ncbi:MAG: peptidase M14 [Bacteriovoracaceae bacterium]|jgi:succinylglutamate desuccinylase|nr:peptidase M14 [Bacteriovoracaceae bacterium]
MENIKLSILKSVPDKFFTTSLAQIDQVFDGPTLLELEGRDKRPLFISTLIHGNETTSYYCLKTLLEVFRNRTLPRSLLIYIGNPVGAAKGLRILPGSPDLNRVWAGGEGAYEILSKQVFEYAKERNIFANIDIHNNTGKNPFYACVNSLGSNFLYLASHFAKKVVYFTEPHTVQSMAFAKLAPSLVLECAQSGNSVAKENCDRFIEWLIHLEEYPTSFEVPGDVEVFQTRATITIPEDGLFDFDNNPSSDNDFSFITDLDQHNFRWVEVGTLLAQHTGSKKLIVTDRMGIDIGDGIFDYSDGKITTKHPIFPSMLTKDAAVAHSDCLGYIMEELNFKSI